MDEDFCIAAVEEALARFGRPGIFNTDQGSQLTSRRFVEMVQGAGTLVSMDGRGRWLDNVFIERLWRSVKCECVYLHAFETASDLRSGLTGWVGLYHARRPHSALARFDNQPGISLGKAARLSEGMGPPHLSDLPRERRAVGSVLRHGFQPPEAQQGPSRPTVQSVHPQGRTPGVDACQERSVDAARTSVLADGMVDRQHVRLVAAVVERRAAVAGRAEGNALRRVRSVGPAGEVGREQARHVQQERPIANLAGARGLIEVVMLPAPLRLIQASRRPCAGRHRRPATRSRRAQEARRRG